MLRESFGFIDREASILALVLWYGRWIDLKQIEDGDDK